jgi:hypothetical protein
MDTRAPLDPSTVHDVNRWQPLTYVDGSGALVTPSFVGAHWQRVRPFAMASSDELRSPTGPARVGSPEFVAQAQALIEVSAALTDEQKVIAEYWADGPRSELPPGHWNLLAQQVSHRDRTGESEHDLDQAVKLFFALTNAIFDAGCCAWDNKRAFDSVRPITAIRFLFAGKNIRAWGGPGRGTQTIAGEEWFPYTLTWATFSAAAAQAGISRRYGGIHFEQGDLDARTIGKSAARQCWAKALTYFDGTAPSSVRS